jgi:hypothetical protein
LTQSAKRRGRNVIVMKPLVAAWGWAGGFGEWASSSHGGRDGQAGEGFRDLLWS